MEKYADAAVNLLVLAHKFEDDTSDFGRLCVAELNKMAYELLNKMAVDEKLTLMMLLNQIKAIADAKGESDKLRQMATFWEMLNDEGHPENREIVKKYGKMVLQAVMGMLEPTLANYGPTHELQKKKKVIDDVLQRIITT